MGEGRPTCLGRGSETRAARCVEAAKLCGPPVCRRGRQGRRTQRKGKAMPKEKEQLFADFVHFTAIHGYGAGYQRDPHQSVPPDCVFLRFRYPAGGPFTSAWIVQFRQRPILISRGQGVQTRRVYARPTYGGSNPDVVLSEV